jgi:hypothetical protein
MNRSKQPVFAYVLTLICALFTLAQAQTPRVSTVNISAESEKVHIAAQGDVSELRVDVADEQGDIMFQSGQIAGQTLDWNMRDSANERVAAGTYLVTVTYRNAAGKLRKRVEQVTVDEAEKPSSKPTPAAPEAVQATITGAGTNGKVAKFTGAATIGNSVITESAGKVGIGTAVPVSPLTVVGTVSNVPALSTINNSMDGIGVKGSSTNASGVGVWGIHTATTGVTPGVKGETNSREDNAVGVMGQVNPTTSGGRSIAVLAINQGTGPKSVGVLGTVGGSGTGIYGYSYNGIGVAGSSDIGDAGHFAGKVFVGGQLEVTNGCMGCSPPSDRNLKANFSTVNPRFILDRLSTIPIQSWNYKSEDTTTRHIGPMAQDFRAAFGLGENDKTLNTVDAQGVTMAAIQGLYQQNQELIRKVGQLQTRVAQLEHRGKKRSHRR